MGHALNVLFSLLIIAPKALTSPAAEDPIGLRPMSGVAQKRFLRRIESPASPMKFGALVPSGSNWGPVILMIKDGRVDFPEPHFLGIFLRKVILRWCADTQNDRF